MDMEREALRIADAWNFVFWHGERRRGIQKQQRGHPQYDREADDNSRQPCRARHSLAQPCAMVCGVGDSVSLFVSRKIVCHFCKVEE